MLYIAYFIIVSGHNIKKKFCKNFHFYLQRVENRLSSLCTHQMPLNHLQTAISKLLGGPWHGLHRPSGHYVATGGHIACMHAFSVKLVIASLR